MEWFSIDSFQTQRLSNGNYDECVQVIERKVRIIREEEVKKLKSKERKTASVGWIQVLQSCAISAAEQWTGKLSSSPPKRQSGDGPRLKELKLEPAHVNFMINHYHDYEACSPIFFLTFGDKSSECRSEIVWIFPSDIFLLSATYHRSQQRSGSEKWLLQLSRIHVRLLLRGTDFQ